MPTFSTPHGRAAAFAALAILAVACGDYRNGPETQRLTIAGGAAAGTGAVTSEPAGIACIVNGPATSGTCAADFPADVDVTLRSAPSGGSTFGGWTGACGMNADAPTCAVTLAADLTVTATFLPPSTVFAGFVGFAEKRSRGGILIVNIPTAAFLTSPTPAGWPSLPSSSFRPPPLVASGTLRVLRTTTIVNLTGVFDPGKSSQQLCLVEAPPGADDPCDPPAGVWQVEGSRDDASVVSGLFDGPLGHGSIRMLPSPSASPPTLYCGTLTVTGATTPGGTLNVALAGPRLTGQFVLAAGPFGALDVDGTVEGRDVSMTGGVFGAPFSATGELNAAATAIAGTWRHVDIDNTETLGIWSATTACE